VEANKAIWVATNVDDNVEDGSTIQIVTSETVSGQDTPNTEGGIGKKAKVTSSSLYVGSSYRGCPSSSAE